MNKHTTRNQLREQIAREVDQLLADSPGAKSIFRKHARQFKVLHDEWRESHARYEEGNAEDRPEDPARWEIEDKTCCHYVTAGLIRDTVSGGRGKPVVGDILGQDEDDPGNAFSRVSFLICRKQSPYGFDTLRSLVSWIKQDLRGQKNGTGQALSQTEQAEPGGGDGQLYAALDLSHRTLTVGNETFPLSEKVWEFLKELYWRKGKGEITPTHGYKSAVDTLRRKVGGKDALRRVIQFQPGGGYKLYPEVQVKGTGQVGLKKSH